MAGAGRGRGLLCVSAVFSKPENPPHPPPPLKPTRYPPNKRSYSNEPGEDADGGACDRGYWLVDDAGTDAPVFKGFQDYFAAADAFLEDHAKWHGGAAPDLNVFRRWAVAKLGELAGYTEVPLPAVRPLDAAAAAIGGGH